MKKYFLVAGLVFAIFREPGHAADEKTFAGNWLRNMARSGPDAVQHENAGPGWFTNLGPTGIRAMLTDRDGKTEWKGNGTQYIVKYVFPGSPAAGKVLPGDIVIGANGKPFENVYKFGYWFGIGYEGPMLEIGRAVEESESKLQGRLVLSILRNGRQKTVDLQLTRKDAFATTFPFECKKSRELRQDAINYLLRTQQDDGRWHGSAHAQFMACMALLAQGRNEKQCLTAVQKCLDRFSKQPIDDGTWHWPLSFCAIAMAEYQMMTGDRQYMDYMARIDAQLKRNSTRYGNGTFGHVGLAEGSKGYGPMCGLTSLVVLSWITMDRAGVPIYSEGLEKALTQLDMALVRKDGYDYGYGYGWGPKARSTVAALDPKLIRSTLGDLHKDTTTFSKKRSAGITLGLMSMVHTFHPWQSYSNDLATHHLNLLVKSRRCIVNGHGSGILHAWSCLTALGLAANRGNREPLRMVLDFNKAYLNAARCHDGSFYTQPQRDDLGSDLNRGSRTLPTSLWLLALSIPDRQLQLIGAEQPQ